MPVALRNGGKGRRGTAAAISDMPLLAAASSLLAEAAAATQQPVSPTQDLAAIVADLQRQVQLQATQLRAHAETEQASREALRVELQQSRARGLELELENSTLRTARATGNASDVAPAVGDSDSEWEQSDGGGFGVVDTPDASDGGAALDGGGVASDATYLDLDTEDEEEEDVSSLVGELYIGPAGSNTLHGQIVPGDHVAVKQIWSMLNISNIIPCFDMLDALRKIVRNMDEVIELRRRGDLTATVNMLAGGMCQSGKCQIIYLVCLITRWYSVSHFLITHFVEGRKDAVAKLNTLLLGAQETGHWGTHAILPCAGRKTHEVEARDEAVRTGGTIVVNDTAAAIRAAAAMYHRMFFKTPQRGVGVIPGSAFVATYDEADLMFRTDNEATMLEQEINDFIRNDDRTPLITIEVSGTLVPNLIKVRRPNSFFERHIIFTTPGPDYVGVDRIIPIADANGAELFLHDKDLVPSNSFSNEKTRRIFEHAASRPTSLLINMVTSRQYTSSSSNTTIAIAAREKHHNIAVIVLNGRRVGEKKYRLPGNNPWVLADDTLQADANEGRAQRSLRPVNFKKAVGDIIEHVDTIAPGVPVFVFCYRSFMRSVSLRGDRRVPSHIVVYGTAGLSVSEILQALSRPFGNQLAALRAQGFENVRALTKRADLTSLKANQVLIDTVRARLLNGMCLLQAVHNLPAEANLMYEQQRPLATKRAAIVPSTNTFRDGEPSHTLREADERHVELQRAKRRSQRAGVWVPSPEMDQKAKTHRARRDAQEGGRLMRVVQFVPDPSVRGEVLTDLQLVHACAVVVRRRMGATKQAYACIDDLTVEWAARQKEWASMERTLINRSGDGGGVSAALLRRRIWALSRSFPAIFTVRGQASVHGNTLVLANTRMHGGPGGAGQRVEEDLTVHCTSRMAASEDPEDIALLLSFAGFPQPTSEVHLGNMLSEFGAAAGTLREAFRVRFAEDMQSFKTGLGADLPHSFWQRGRVWAAAEFNDVVAPIPGLLASHLYHADAFMSQTAPIKPFRVLPAFVAHRRGNSFVLSDFAKDWLDSASADSSDEDDTAAVGTKRKQRTRLCFIDHLYAEINGDANKHAVWCAGRTIAGRPYPADAEGFVIDDAAAFLASACERTDAWVKYCLDPTSLKGKLSVWRLHLLDGAWVSKEEQVEPFDVDCDLRLFADRGMGDASRRHAMHKAREQLLMTQ
ncbi:hypothetical protein JKP88DRAFT_273617 [Tribonema minus]|uniref:Uncharacterized protein n=1 Tax=Tribonema minus TaxID=303371 RepID=A0A836CC92_9STRA|nr:hypothetical protein JKP88DRAFT_273617 [Tribonema minus]